MFLLQMVFKQRETFAKKILFKKKKQKQKRPKADESNFESLLHLENLYFFLQIIKA